MKDVTEQVVAAVLAIGFTIVGGIAVSKCYGKAMVENHDAVVLKIETEKTRQTALVQGCSVVGETICCAGNR